jgi:acetyl-CoA acetyltransferase
VDEAAFGIEIGVEHTQADPAKLNVNGGAIALGWCQLF